ncbi:oxidoreductase [Limosilactobacillus sp.]|jgi:short-subunit dehydrogenase|uniref:oxidoreductase n=1 Tax=Limosilactobacillus sp. TaxID=2773925 RepID=UPI0025BD58AD|nr:oxidoreductase [Limosilactobacillus sp.]MCH3923259.1 oxidoreductase [Limosilactobacillus sp.]MCH3927941.1 oxidoreductase [Limosilactobacillus sp.]
MTKVVLLTGASSGIGHQTAQSLAQNGYKVYGAARRVKSMEDLNAAGIVPIQLDITLEDSIQAAVKEVIDREGRIDILINNAGYGSYGAVEDVTIEEAKRQFEVNLFGLAELTKAVLPYMRAQKSGKIINVSSMGGRLTTKFGAWYHATKYALEAFSDALRLETKAFGIDVILVEPGGIKTPWGFIAADNLRKSAQGGAYEQQARKTADSMTRQYSSNLLSSPKVIAKTMLKIANAKHPKARYLVGFGAKPFVFLHTILPTRAFDFIISKAS